MRPLMELVSSKRLNLRPLLTHDFALSEIVKAYDVFGNGEGGVFKVLSETGCLARQ
jgi:alcohol dehydrogenase